ncbi:hypothetical protein F383_05597 [Gossypium arboreum]|uniref:non-specific serine/threonine protein kinase n=1 Tax=Gossypium arboreum TaxID=29729 RepID=A0A0B0N4H5_GOSAR|nr:hypothetical protein F383_05597 [Gossypium arboreum]
MMMRVKECLLALWLWCGCLLLLASDSPVTDPSEVSALLAVKKQLVDPLNRLRKWNKGDPCTSSWTGVECSDHQGNDGYLHVKELQLQNMNLSGTLAPELGQLYHLEILDFMWNDLTGSIPKEIGHLSTLRLLLLNGNNLSGSLPDELGYLQELDRFQIDQNNLSGQIPKSFANLSSVKHIHFNNNSLSGQIPLELSLLSTLLHVLGGNPVCRNANSLNISLFCGSEPGEDDMLNLNRSKMECRSQSCPMGYEYVPASPVPCFCAAPLRIGYRLKSPSFSYFPPYIRPFEVYLTSSLNFSLYQLYIDTYVWDKGPRLRMYLKLFPSVNSTPSNTFNESEVRRIRDIYASWSFSGSDFFGPYELLNFTLLGPYANIDFGSENKGISTGIVVAVVVGGVACAVATSVIITILMKRRYARHHPTKASMKIEGVRDFTFKEAALATDNFNSSTQVGQGGYGKVYKGTLSDKTVVAIKRAEEGSLQGQKEFLTEIKLLSRLHHRNLVSLVGYCDEEGEQMLVYEFMPNGTLRDWLSAKAKNTLNFGMRLRIALGSARGILYLHTEANPPVFHRDIKATNILLDSNLNAKVSDFGLSRLAPVLEEEGTVPDHVSTVVKGTPGYLDPEYFLTHKLTDKSDVYSLGVVFLELLTGMHPIWHGKNIVREVKTAHESGMVLSLIDSRMGWYPAECMERMVSLALSCCNDEPEKRPSMLDVVRQLEYVLKMMPETDSVSSSTELVQLYSGKSLTSSSSYGGTSREVYASSLNVTGSDLVSGVIPSIAPR